MLFVQPEKCKWDGLLRMAIKEQCLRDVWEQHALQCGWCDHAVRDVSSDD